MGVAVLANDLITGQIFQVLKNGLCTLSSPLVLPNLNEVVVLARVEPIVVVLGSGWILGSLVFLGGVECHDLLAFADEARQELGCFLLHWSSRCLL